jgi:uncharacterized protein YbjQ (UPF0145 family)
MDDSGNVVFLVINALLNLLGLLIPLGFLALGYAIGHYRERKHLQVLAVREARYSGVMVTDLKSIPANWRCSDAQLVQGQAVIASDYFKTFAAGLRNFLGGEVRSLETLMARARREATLRMVEEAAALGANAVWCVRLETSTIGRGHARRGLAIAEVFAYGTALRVESNP